jgi:tRNA(Ile)-lysidine synthase TilS/MesJ
VPLATRYPTVSVVTAHGRQQLAADPDDSVFEVLTRNQVPWSGVSIYLRLYGEEAPVLRPCLDSRLSEMPEVDEVLLYFNRNVNPFKFALEGYALVHAASGGSAGTEYFYQRMDNERSECDVYLKQLDPEECRQVVADRVADVVHAQLPDGAPLVIGVSGGGDSNALLHGLTRLPDVRDRLHPIIIKGIPDWDLGVPRAQALCDDYGLQLTIIEEPDVKALLGMSDDGVPLVDRFEREFVGDDFEFLGTLLIRLALSGHARTLGTEFICTGLNLEDVVCENLFRISTGLKPAGTPVRRIGDVSLLMPLWLCPKRIIDGCFPKYSLDNYEARYPCFSLGRNLYYSVVYSMQSQFPGFIEQLAQGFSTAASENPVEYTYDEQLGFHVERLVPLALRRKFQKMVGRSAVS